MVLPITPVQKIPTLLNINRNQKEYNANTANTPVPNNKNQEELNEPKTNVIEATAALLRAKQPGKS